MNGLFQVPGIKLPQFYNPETLNIFCDASISGKGYNTTGCYGVVAVTEDNIIETEYRLVSHTTSNNSELKGLRCALSMANKYKDQFRFINIFSDSQISVFGLRDYIYNWRYNPKDNRLYGSAGKPIINQEIFIECHGILMQLGTYPNCIIRLFHQSGHIDNGYDNLKKAASVFGSSNNVRGNIDLNFIRYISTYNNFVDSTSRSYLRRANKKLTYCDPIEFEPRGRINRY